VLIMASIAGGSAYAWRTGRTQGAAIFIAIAYSVFSVIIVQLLQPSGVLWVYTVLVSNFLLVGRTPALLLSSIVIAGVLLGDSDLANATDRMTFVATSLLVCMFSYVFASRAARQRAELKAVALRDPLTGAGNRRGLQAELEIAMAASIRSGQPLGLLVFDLDHFKQVNDSFGHEAGDDVLLQISRLVHATTRMQDRFFRLGGEEFALLLPGTSVDALRNVAEKLRDSVERQVQCRGRTITILIGAAPFHPADTPAGWLSRADAAMYEAKRSGRNRTVVCGGWRESQPGVEREAVAPGD